CARREARAPDRARAILGPWLAPARAGHLSLLELGGHYQQAAVDHLRLRQSFSDLLQALVVDGVAVQGPADRPTVNARQRSEGHRRQAPPTHLVLQARDVHHASAMSDGYGH